MKNYKVTLVVSETWELTVPARSKFFAERKIKAMNDRQLIARGGSIERTDLFTQVEEAE